MTKSKGLEKRIREIVKKRVADVDEISLFNASVTVSAILSAQHYTDI